MNTVLAAVGTVTGAYLALAGALWLLQPRLVFLPDAGGGIQRTPDVAGLGYRDVRIPTADGLQLAGWLVAGPGPEAPTVLFLHGNAGNIGDRIDTLDLLHRAGAAVLIIDYRGYGASEGSPSEQGLHADALAAWRWLVEEEHADPERIVLFGRSLGAAVAAELATRVRPAGVVLESAFTSLPALAAHHYPWLPARWLTRYRFATDAALERVEAPVLVAHSADDEIVPFEHGQRLARMRPPVIEFQRLTGDHNSAFLVSQPDYGRALARFLATVTATRDRGGHVG